MNWWLGCCLMVALHNCNRSWHCLIRECSDQTGPGLFILIYMFRRCVMMDPVDSLLLNTSLAKHANPVNPDAPAVTYCEHSGAFHS